MENNEDVQKDDLNEELNELEKLFSGLITGIDELNIKAEEEAKVKNLKNNSIEEKEKEDILNQIEVENNIIRQALKEGIIIL